MLSRRSELSWYTCEASCSELRSFEVLGPQSGPDPQSGPLERAETLDQEQIGPFGDHGAPEATVRRGPLARCTRLETS